MNADGSLSEAAGAARGFYRPHSGFPIWQPSDDPQEILDEALVWAAKSDRVEVLGPLVELGADVDGDPYRGTPLIWAAVNGRLAAMARLIELGADVNRKGDIRRPRPRAGRHRLAPGRADRSDARRFVALLAAGADRHDRGRDPRRPALGLGRLRRPQGDREAAATQRRSAGSRSNFGKKH